MNTKTKLLWGLITAIALLAVITMSFLIRCSAPLPEMEEATETEEVTEEMAQPPDRFSAIERALERMEFGNIVFNTPTNINIDDSPQIQLILSLAETVEKLKQSITEEGEKVGATIRVSHRMEARLSGYMFQITAITPEIQAVSKHQQTEWKWEVHPREEGKHKLHLTLVVFLEIDGNSTPRAIRTFDKIIEVNATATQKISLFFKNNWQWLWAAILVPVAGLLWRKRKKK